MYLIAREKEEAKFFILGAGLCFPHRRSLEEPSNHTILGLYLAYSSCIKYVNVQAKNYTTSSEFYILLYLLRRNKLFNFQTVSIMAEKTTSVKTDKIVKTLHECLQRNLLHQSNSWKIKPSIFYFSFCQAVTHRSVPECSALNKEQISLVVLNSSRWSRGSSFSLTVSMKKQVSAFYISRCRWGKI